MRVVLALCLALVCSQAIASLVVVQSDRMAYGRVDLIGGSVEDVNQSLALNPADWLDLSAHAVNSDGQSSGDASSFQHSGFAGSTFSFDGNVAFSQSGPTSSGGLAFARASIYFLVTSPSVVFSANLIDMGSGGVLRLGYENGAELLEVFTGYNDSFELGPGYYYVTSIARATNGIDDDFSYSFGFDSEVTFGVLPELSSIATWSLIALGSCLSAGRRCYRRQ